MLIGHRVKEGVKQSWGDEIKQLSMSSIVSSMAWLNQLAITRTANRFNGCLGGITGRFLMCSPDVSPVVNTTVAMDHTRKIIVSMNGFQNYFDANPLNSGADGSPAHRIGQEV